MRASRFPLLLAAALLPCAAAAADSVMIETGRAFTRDRDLELTRIGFTWDWRRQWAVADGWTLGGYWETSVGQWRGMGRTGMRDTWDLTAGPVFRLSAAPQGGVTPYLDAGLGLHWLSHRELTAKMRSGTNYQFGLTLGVGVRFGEGERFDVGLRVRHLSNAGIQRPNYGMNVAELRFLYAY